MSRIFGDGVVTVNRYASCKAESTGRNLMGSKSKSCRAPPQKNLVQESDQCQRCRQNGWRQFPTPGAGPSTCPPSGRRSYNSPAAAAACDDMYTLVVPAIISSVAIYSLFTHVPHQGTSAMVSFPSLCTLLYNLHLAISFPYFAVVLFFPSSSFYFEGSVRLLVVIDSLRRKCARSLVIIKTPLQGEKMPHRLAPSSGCPSIIRVNPHGILAVAAVV